MTNFKPQQFACAAAAFAAALLAAPAQASLSASLSTDVAAARASFQAQSAVLDAFDWSTLFAPGTHSTGQLGAWFSAGEVSFTAAGGAVNRAVAVNVGGSGTLAMGNWIDGSGFDGVGGAAAADLAVNGNESFDLRFGSAYRSMGLAISTGAGNFPRDVDLAGASFDFTARDATGQAVGSASVMLPAGAPYTAWLTLVASAPIYSLEVREATGATQMDQYFGNVLVTASAVSAVPEPSSWLLLAMGLAGMAMLRRQRAAAGTARGSLSR
jgi:PEP-CTERM motif